MREIVNFLQGSVKLQVSGPFPERFLNLCATNGVGFWGVEWIDAATLAVTVPRRCRRRAVRLAEQALCQVTVLRGNGVPALLAHFHRRYAFLAGLGLSLMAVAILSHVIFVVDVRGNETVSSAVIVQELRQAGLTIGSFGPWISARDVAHQVLLADDRFCYMAVNIHGIRADVVVRETVQPPEIEDDDTPTSLVATLPGVISRMEVRDGEKQVAVGDTVVAGEVLVSGEMNYQNPETGELLTTVQTAARGKIWARTWRSDTGIVPLSWEEKQLTGREKTQFRLKILGWSIKFYQNGRIPFDKYDRITTTKQMRLPGGITLPVWWITTTCREYDTTTGTRNESEAENDVKALLLQRLQDGLGEEDAVTQTSYSLQQTGQLLAVTLDSECSRQIAQRVPLTQRNPMTTEGYETIHD